MNNFSKTIHLFPPNLACFAPWRESSPLIEISPDVMSNNKCLHLRGTTLVRRLPEFSLLQWDMTKIRREISDVDS
jgi:hypothetical protein